MAEPAPQPPAEDHPAPRPSTPFPERARRTRPAALSVSEIARLCSLQDGAVFGDPRDILDIAGRTPWGVAVVLYGRHAVIQREDAPRLERRGIPFEYVTAGPDGRPLYSLSGGGPPPLIRPPQPGGETSPPAPPARSP